MEVILNKDVEKLGKAGQVIKVKDGFARNFLMPGGLAVAATAANLEKLKQQQIIKAQQQEKIKRDAEALKAKLAGVSVTIPALVHEEERLYGGIGSQEISAVLKEEGFEIDKNCILLDEPIKSLGIYEVPLRLHPEVSLKLKIWVVKK
jgi:large subunit ribosomal protein L9